MDPSNHINSNTAKLTCAPSEIVEYLLPEENWNENLVESDANNQQIKDSPRSDSGHISEEFK